MYAIVRTGGKQYKVQAGDVIRVEKLDSVLGSEVELTDVLMVGGETTVVGQPTVKNAKVTVVVTKQTKDRKVIIFKKKRRQGYRRFKTHRQPFTELFIKSIALDGKVSKAEESANVVDVVKVREERIAARTAEKIANRQSEGILEKAERKAAKTAAKKAAPKKTAKKKTAKAATKKSSSKKAKAKK